MAFENWKNIKNQRGFVIVERNVTTRQARLNPIIRQAIGQVNPLSLTDDDGVQQFILGVTPMDANHRVGHADI